MSGRAGGRSPLAKGRHMGRLCFNTNQSPRSDGRDCDQASGIKRQRIFERITCSAEYDHAKTPLRDVLLKREILVAGHEYREPSVLGLSKQCAVLETCPRFLLDSTNVVPDQVRRRFDYPSDAVNLIAFGVVEHVAGHLSRVNDHTPGGFRDSVDEGSDLEIPSITCFMTGECGLNPFVAGGAAFLSSFRGAELSCSKPGIGRSAGMNWVSIITPRASRRSVGSSMAGISPV
jgi:hypothetical protein